MAVAAAVGLARSAAAQEPPSGKDADGRKSPVANRQQSTATRALPDGLRFANGLLNQRKYDLAAEEYERFMSSGAKGQDLDDARFGLATARLYQGNYPAARQAFEQYLANAPDEARKLTARYRLGEMAYLVGDLAGARRSLEEFTAATRNHAGLEMAWTYLGDTRFGLQDYASARQAYEKSLSAFPTGRLVERAKYGLGRSLAALGNRTEAIAILEELARRGSADWIDRCWLQIGMIRQSAGQLEDAIVAFANLERAAPRSALRTEAQLRRAVALIQLKRTQEAEPLLRALVGDASAVQGARASLELATIELESNNQDAALATLNNALKRFPASPYAPALQFRVAEVLKKQNQLTEAQAQFELVAEVNPNDPWADDALEHAAQCAFDRGDPVTARRLAARFAAQFPKSPLDSQVRLIDGRAAAQEGKHTEAIAILKSLVDSPTNAATKPSPPKLPAALAQAARYELALSFRALGQSAQAEPILAGLAKDSTGPITADAQFLIGQGHVGAGRYAEAIPSLQAYLHANPRGDVADVALAHLAAAQVGIGRLDDARKTLADLAERFPRSKALPPTRLRFAEAALAANQPERAAEQFRHVAGVAPDANSPLDVVAPKSNDQPDVALRFRALAGLGKSLWKLGKPGDAAEAFAAALEVDPDSPSAPEIALRQGRALEMSKQPDAAVKIYARVLERFAKSDAAPQAALAQARLFAKAGRREEAATAFQRLFDDERVRGLLEATGVNADTLLSEWGWALLEADKTTESDRVFARLLKEYPDSPLAADARFNLAESANTAGNHAEVVRLLAPLIAVQPAEKDGGASQSRPADRPASKSSPTDPAARDNLKRLLPAVLYRLGRTQVAIKDWAHAVATLDRLFAEFPDSSYHREARYLRAEAALRRGDAAAAEAGFATILSEPSTAADPKGLISVVRLKQIQCWVALKRWNDAIAGAQKLKGELPAADPAIAEIEYVTGQALLGVGRLDEARAAFQSVIDIRKEGELVAQAMLMRGETYFHQDRFREALRDFLKVDILHDSPRWQAESLLEAGKVYERLDQWAEAAETYQRLVNKFPAEPSAAQARKRLAAASRRAASTSNGKKS
jgi:TolA-binding protein